MKYCRRELIIWRKWQNSNQKCLFKIRGVLLALGLFTFWICSAQEKKDSLWVGSAAPALKVEKWIKGDPISTLEKGHVYIIEFGAVGCGPCRASIPHLSELTKKYSGKATFISVYIWENARDTTNLDKAYIKRVEKFIKSMGEKIEFHVAVDDPNQTMAYTWMRAAGEGGIPTAFIVDKTGTIVWIGHPMNLDRNVEEVIKGNFNPSSGVALKKHMNDEYTRIEEASRMGNYTKALEGTDKLILENPEDKYIYYTKFTILLSMDESIAYKYGLELLKNECRDSEPVLDYLASFLVNRNGLKFRDYDLACNFAERASQLSTFEPTLAYLITLRAKAFFMKSDYQSAVKEEKQAIAFLGTCDQKDMDVQNLQTLCKTDLKQYIKKQSSN
jgi:thiol-disulfide isomerase/thioredoxin